jgi:predicted nucleic acid-binding protein
LSDFFVDTSALAKRYIPETGSAWLTGWVEPIAGNVVIISAVTIVEMISLMVRREHEGNISTSARIKIQNDFLLHVEREYLVIELDKDLLTSARSVVVNHQLRTLDALQLASAVVAEKSLGIKITLVSADQKLLPAAVAEGFMVDDPEQHP